MLTTVWSEMVLPVMSAMVLPMMRVMVQLSRSKTQAYDVSRTRSVRLPNPLRVSPEAEQGVS